MYVIIIIISVIMLNLFLLRHLTKMLHSSVSMVVYYCVVIVVISNLGFDLVLNISQSWSWTVGFCLESVKTTWMWNIAVPSFLIPLHFYQRHSFPFIWFFICSAPTISVSWSQDHLKVRERGLGFVLRPCDLNLVSCSLCLAVSSLHMLLVLRFAVMVLVSTTSLLSI